MSLTDIKIKNLKAKDKAFKVNDGDGLYLLIKPNGARLWRYDYALDGKRKTASFGAYPEIGLAEARSKLADTKTMLKEGTDPTIEKRKVIREELAATSSSEMYQAVGEDFLTWIKSKRPALAARTISKKEWIIRDIASPALANKRMRDILPLDVLGILQSLEKRSQLETAKRTRSTLSALFRYAVWAGKADQDPVATLVGAVASPTPVNHAAITDEKEFGTLLSVMNSYSGWYAVRLSLMFIAHTFCRPGEARLATWDEIDFEQKVWVIPAERMKMRREHQVPLSQQALSILKEAKATDPYSPLLFPSVRSNKKPLSDNALNAALRRMGYTSKDVVAHGMRSSASTILNERGFDSEIIELQLSHASADRIKRIYDRGERWDKRVKLMRDWGRICQRLMLA